MIEVKNLFKQIPEELKEELFESLIETDQIKVEKIISDAHSSPPDFCYDSEKNEFVLLLKGSAQISFEDDDKVELKPGNYLIIPAHKKLFGFLRSTVFTVRQEGVADFTALVAFVIQYCPTRRTCISLLLHCFNSLSSQYLGFLAKSTDIPKRAGSDGLGADGAQVFVIKLLILFKEQGFLRCYDQAN